MGGFCGECGAKLTGAKFCGECGAKVGGGSAPAASSSSPPATLTPGPAVAGGLRPGPDVELADESFASPAMARAAAALPDKGPGNAEAVDMRAFLNNTEYKIKEANAGIAKHVTKQWAAGLTNEGSDAGIYITKTFQYLSSPAMMEDYTQYYNKMESQGYGLSNASKKLQTAQAWFAPDSRAKLESVLKQGFSNLSTLSFYKDPTQCIRESPGGNTLVLCRVLLAGHRELNGKYLVDSGKGVMPAFLVEYRIGEAASNV